jgi:hypothetical protein
MYFSLKKKKKKSLHTSMLSLQLVSRTLHHYMGNEDKRKKEKKKKGKKKGLNRVDHVVEGKKSLGKRNE